MIGVSAIATGPIAASNDASGGTLAGTFARLTGEVTGFTRRATFAGAFPALTGAFTGEVETLALSGAFSTLTAEFTGVRVPAPRLLAIFPPLTAEFTGSKTYSAPFAALTGALTGTVTRSMGRTASDGMDFVTGATSDATYRLRTRARFSEGLTTANVLAAVSADGLALDEAIRRILDLSLEA